MQTANIKSLAPQGPHIEGLIRFSYEERECGERQQLPQFEILTRVHEKPPAVGEVPRMTPHPISETLMHKDSKEEGHRLIKEIPIRFLGRTPETILSAKYQAFEASTGRMLCTGDGENAAQRERGTNQVRAVRCSGPEVCSFANEEGVACNLHCRMNVQVDGSTDPLAVFEFQSSGINTYRTLVSKLRMLHALYGNLRGLPFRLTSWAKSSGQSLHKTFYCANIELRDGHQLGKLAVDKDDPFAGLSDAALDRLEEVMAQMTKEGAFAMEGGESLVTTWTPASVISVSRSRPVAGPASVSATQELADVIQRAKGSSLEQTSDASVPTIEVITQEGEKIAQPSSLPVLAEVAEDSDKTYI